MRVWWTIAALLALSACAHRPDRVVLLPNADGRSSSIVVTTAKGEYPIASRYEAVEFRNGAGERKMLSEEEVRLRYGKLLEAQPHRPTSWTVFFFNGKAELTNESKAIFRQVVDAMRGFPAPEIMVVGHTDTMGAAEMNDKLALQRATFIRDQLVAIGIAGEKIEVVGRGERELLVPTRDETPEERNRRVEIKLR